MAKSADNRVLEIYMRISRGEVITQEQIKEEYDIGRSTFYRDIKELRETLAEMVGSEVKLVCKNRYYSLSQPATPQSSHLYLLSKLLIGSRALNSKEMQEILSSLSKASSVHGRAFLRESVINEARNYKSITDDRDRIDMLYKIETSIQKKHQLLLNLDNNTKQKDYQIYPVEVFFDNYYFYLLGIYKGKYKIFKINDVKSFTELPRSAHVDIDPSSIKMKYQFVFPNVDILDSENEVIKLKVEWTGDKNYLYDFFQNVKVIKSSEGEEVICELTIRDSAGLKMWLLMNSEYIKIIEPQWLAKELQEVYRKSIEKYK